MTIFDRAAGAALGLAVMAGVVWGANAPIAVHDSEQAVLRLAWSVRPERVERCRQQSEEELARLPAHMRQPLVCDGASAQYRLTVRHEGKTVTDEVVHGGGLRQDRRIYVFHERPMDPGEVSIDIRFDRVDSGPSEVSAAETVPPHLMLVERLQVRPREVILVTYAPDQRALVALQGSVHTAR